MKKIYFLTICIITYFANTTILSAQNETSQDKEQYKDFKSEHVWDAKVKIAKSIFLGKSKRGTRNIIPITGGEFNGKK